MLSRKTGKPQNCHNKKNEMKKTLFNNIASACNLIIGAAFCGSIIIVAIYAYKSNPAAFDMGPCMSFSQIVNLK